MNLHVVVTQEDIEHGVQSSCQQCPHALAIARAAQAYQAFVYSYIVYIYPSRQSPSIKCALPPSVTEWIKGFDHGLPVAPMEYDLKLP